MKRNVFIASVFILFFALYQQDSHGRVLIGKEQALELAFAGADSIEKKSFVLKQDQVGQIEKLSRSKLESKLFLFYIALKDGEPIGYAAIDSHIVRTKTQTVMVVINPDGSLNYTEVLAFYEPMEYKATNSWIELYNDKTLNDKLKVGYDIPNITGATLTSYNTASAVRKILAAYKVLINGAKRD